MEHNVCALDKSVTYDDKYEILILQQVIFSFFFFSFTLTLFYELIYKYSNYNLS